MEHIRENHNYTSPEYRAWVNESAAANTTSLQQVRTSSLLCVFYHPLPSTYVQLLILLTLTHQSIVLQVIGAYMADYTVADTGGDDYVPRAGYVGTLAPSESIEDQLPTNQLPKRVLHPWPAVQEIDVHNNRNPPVHPYIPHPLVILAQNDMLVRKTTN